MIQTGICKLPVVSTSYSANDANIEGNVVTYLFKQPINSAIHVEKTIQIMSPTSNYKDGSLQFQNLRILKTKRCSCSIDIFSCPCHQSIHLLKEVEEVDEDDLDDRIEEILETQPDQDDHDGYCDRDYGIELDGCDDHCAGNCNGEVNRHGHGDNHGEGDADDEGDAHSEGDGPDEADNHDAADVDIVSDTSSGRTSTVSSSTQITVKLSNKTFQCGTKLSLSSISTFRQNCENESIRQWLAKKCEEKRRKNEWETKMREQKDLERQITLEKERENFKCWLAHKKRQDMIKKTEMQKQLELEKLKALEKEKRQLENEINYHVWLKRKEEESLDKMTQDQLKSIQSKIEKEQKLQANQKAFRAWLESSKGKQKPIPFNQGLDSLRSSASVTYVNPIPWTPNIELSRKFSSH